MLTTLQVCENVISKQYLCSDAQECVWQMSEVEGEAGRDLVSFDVQAGAPLATLCGFFCRGRECTIRLSGSEPVFQK